MRFSKLFIECDNFLLQILQSELATYKWNEKYPISVTKYIIQQSLSTFPSLLMCSNNIIRVKNLQLFHSSQVLS